MHLTKYSKLIPITIVVALFITASVLLPGTINASNTYDFSNQSYYNFTYLGPSQNSTAGLGTKILFSDINNNGKDDLLVSAPSAGENSDIGYLYVIYDELYETLQGANAIDLSDSNNYSLRFNGPEISTHNIYLSLGGFTTADIDGDGNQDLIVGAYGTDFNSRGNSGSIYIIYNDLIQSYPGKNIDLLDEGNYNFRIDGPITKYALTNNSTVLAKDIDNDGRPDLMFGSSETFDQSNIGEGSLWIIYNDIIRAYLSKNIDLADDSNYSLRIQGADVDHQFSTSFYLNDIYNLGKQDLIIGAPGAGYNSRPYSGSTYVISNQLLNSIQTKSVSVDNSDNYSLRIDGASSQDKISISGLLSGKVFGENNDLLISAASAGYNSRPASGSVWVISNNLINTFQTKTVDLASDENYSIRIDGDSNTSFLGKMEITDFTGDEQNDLILGSIFSSNYFGSVFVLDNSLIKSNSLVKNVDLATTNNYSIRYVGPASYSGFGGSIASPYSNQTGKMDLAIGGSLYGDYQQGGLWFVRNFPHTISVTNTSTNTDTAVVSGTVTTIDSVTPVHGVQYSLDTNSPSGGNWKTCSGTTSFSCTIPKSGGTTHTVYLRAFDTNTSYTARQNYAVTNFAYNTQAGNNSSTSCTTTLNTNLTPTITNLKNLNNNTSVELTLTNTDTNATEYIIEYGTTKTNLNYSALNIPTTTKTYTINKLNPTKQYYFRVRTTNGCGFGNWSTTVKNENVEVKTKETPLRSVTQNFAGQATPLPSVENQEANTEKQTLLQRFFTFISNMFKLII